MKKIIRKSLESKKIIVFDLGNTLIRFDHNIAVRKLAKKFAIDKKTAYDLFFDSELTRLFETGAISPSEFHRGASRLLGISLPRNEFFDIWNDIFWEDKASCALARRLGKRYRMFLLSNVNRSHFSHIRAKFSILKIFDKLVLSFLVGAMKPDKRIFNHVIRLAGAQRNRIVYIDDRKDLIKEAKALGIDSIRFEGAGKLRKQLLDRGIIC